MRGFDPVPGPSPAAEPSVGPDRVRSGSTGSLRLLLLRLLGLLMLLMLAWGDAGRVAASDYSDDLPAANQRP